MKKMKNLMRKFKLRFTKKQLKILTKTKNKVAASLILLTWLSCQEKK